MFKPQKKIHIMQKREIVLNIHLHFIVILGSDIFSRLQETYAKKFKKSIS